MKLKTLSSAFELDTSSSGPVNKVCGIFHSKPDFLSPLFCFVVHPLHTDSPKGKRVEIRFPDPLANPYFAFAAMLMAGLDGIENKIHPGDAMDVNLYALPPEELAKVPNVCGSLRDALEALRDNHDFLLKEDVFTKDLIAAYIALKMEEVERFETMPHPIEYAMYYSG